MMARLEKIFPYLLLAPALVPLVYIGGLVYPYVTPKTFLLQGLGITALALFAYLALSGRPFFYARLRNQSSWIPIALLAIAYISSIFGVDFYRSLWGLFDRGDSLLMLSVITTFFYLVLLSADRIFLERIIKTVTVVAGIVAAIAIMQWIMTGVGGKTWFLPPVTGRIGSTFGNAAFLAGYLGMALFVSLMSMRGSVGLWNRIYKIIAAASILAIFLAATRGTIVALLFSFLVAVSYVALTGAEAIKKTARYVLLALVLFVGIFIGFREQISNVPFEPIQRMASISLTDGTVSSRLFVWKNIGTEALQRPLFGYGAEHVARLFDKVYNPSEIVEQWFDRSHNAYLDYFVQYGVVGLGLYLTLLIAFAILSIKLLRNDSKGILNYGFLFLLFIATYAIQNFFVFDTPLSLWLLYVMFAALCVFLDNSSATSLSNSKTQYYIPVFSGFIIILTTIPVVILPLYANILLTKGYLYHLTDVKKANAYFEKGLSLGTYADVEYGYQAYNMYAERQAVQLSGENRVSAYKYALNALTANYYRHPYDARTATYLGHVIDTAPPDVSVDDIFDKEVLDRAIELSPLRAQAWYMTVNISLRKADSLRDGSKERELYYREAIRILEEYADKQKLLPVPRYILATIYYKLGDKETAKKWADEGLLLYTEPDIAAARPAVKYYLATNEWGNAVRFLSDIVEIDPTNNDTLYDLAKVTYLAGDHATALRIVNKLRNINPALLETDQNFLNAISAYEQSTK